MPGTAVGSSARAVCATSTRSCGALGMAARHGWIAFNPAVLARPPAQQSVSRAAPTAREVRTLLAEAAAEPDLELFPRLAATTGLRPGELVPHSSARPSNHCSADGGLRYDCENRDAVSNCGLDTRWVGYCKCQTWRPL